MDEKKVINIPITYEQKKINEHGDGYVPCLVTNKWLQFSDVSLDEKNIPVNIITQVEGKSPKKIGEMILNKDDLIRAINSVDTIDE